jgi:hypothetical protein
MEMYDCLKRIINVWGIWDKVTELDGGKYAENFEIIKNWVNSNVLKINEYCFVRKDCIIENIYELLERVRFV